MKKKNYRQYIIVCIILSFFMTLGCATSNQSPEQIGYKTIRTAGLVYDGVMKAAGDLYKKGKLSEGERETIEKAANIFYPLYHSTLISYNTWRKTKDENEKIRLDKLYVELKNALPKFQTIVYEILDKHFTTEQ